MSFFNRSTFWGLLLLAFALPFVAGCDSDALSDANPRESNVDPLFDRYVSLGNSITAGFQANGINDVTQNESYAVLLAEQMATTFEIPAIREPGCPPPLENILTGQTVGTVPGGCALREPTTPLALNNVAVPGALTIDVLTNDPTAGASPSALTRLVLGGRTQAEAALDANPTFASVWIGNNDVLGAALAGDPSRITPLDEFEDQYTRIINRLEGNGVEGGVLTSVSNVSFIPFLSPGQAYAAAEGQINAFGSQQSPAWGSFSVDVSCAPGASGANTRVPFSYGFGNLFQQALQGADVTLDCDPDTAPEALLTLTEAAEIIFTLNDYNTFIETLADERGWAYVDVNPALESLYLSGAGDADPANDAVPKFPDVDPDREAGESTFGLWFSEDGVHPSAATHQVVTNLFVEAINDQYGTSLETIDAPPLP